MPRLTVLLLLLALPVAAAPTATARPCAAPPKIDGSLDDPAWAGGTWSTGFLLAGNDQQPDPAAVQTRFKVLCDAQAAYVGVECDEPAIDQLRAVTPWRDGAVWQDDCIEVFFDPAGEGRYYHHLLINARGTIYDDYNADFGLVHSKLWNGDFQAAGKVDAPGKKWSVELAIPYGAIVLPANAGATWKFNVTRERQAGGKSELTTWAPLRGNFHQPELFATLTGLPTDYRAFHWTLGEPQVEVNSSASGWATLSMGLAAKNESGAAHRVTVSAEVLDKPDQKVAAAAVEVAAGAEAKVKLPDLKVQGANQDLVFVVRDADGTLLKAVVKSLSSESKPLGIRLLRPCYRNNIYATEKLKDIAFEAQLSAPVRNATVKVAYRLADVGGKGVAQASVLVADAARPLSLPAANLAVGSYTLTVTALGADGKAVASAETPIRKLPPPDRGDEVRIDEYRRILVNGKPTFTIGWYGNLPTEDPRPDVVALQNITTPDVIYPPKGQGIGDRFMERGTYTIASVENGRFIYAFNLWQQGKEELRKVCEEWHTLTTPSDDMRRLAKEMVDCVRGQQGLYGYYIADEPEIHDVPSVYLENYYKLLCELDPYHPVVVTNDTLDGIVTHGYKCADILSPDPYSPEWDYVPNFLKKANEVGPVGKAIQVTLWHSAGDTHFTQDYGSGRPYPYRVFRNQYLASIAYGAMGFTAYTTPFFMPEPEYRYGLPAVWRELRFLERAITAPPPAEPPAVQGGHELATLARNADGHVYLIVVNHKPGACDAAIKWPGLGARQTLPVMSEGRSVTVNAGAFRDHFEEGDAHVYTDDPAAAKLPTTTQVTAELKRRADECIKPGNLLHVSRGVTARSSEGFYAPWFSQYFYYAINGVTDDLGWQGSHWGGKPIFLELTLKEPADIGRLVLYAPNLGDYSLDLIGPDGATQRIDVKGNTEKLITHRLAHPVRCLKLRLTATKVAEGVPTVSEIEAYADAGEGPATPLTTVLAAAGPAVNPLFAATAEPNALWEERFDPFETAPKYNWDGKDTKWVMDPAKLLAEPKPGGGLVLASSAPEGYATMTHLRPYDPAHRFFQVSIPAIDGNGYKYTYVHCGTSSGQPGYRGSINCNRPGLYTVDTHYISDNFRTGKDKQCFVVVSVAGSAKQPDGNVKLGPKFNFDWIRLVQEPVDGLAVTLADGAPLGDSVKPGDTLRFELRLAKPAADAVVEVQCDSSLTPLQINGEPYVQLRRADDAGRVWVGQVEIGPRTGKFKPTGYPTIFKAAVTGGAIKETFAPVMTAFE